MKIYGPYTRKDGRQHICIVHSCGRRQTKSYPKYLFEQHIGRELLPTETVDHIDNDFTNNSLENLQILTRSENTKKAAVDYNRYQKMFTFICPMCGEEAQKPLSQYRFHNVKHKKAGPFCSKKCSGKFNATR